MKANSILGSEYHCIRCLSIVVRLGAAVAAGEVAALEGARAFTVADTPTEVIAGVVAVTTIVAVVVGGVVSLTTVVAGSVTAVVARIVAAVVSRPVPVVSWIMLAGAFSPPLRRPFLASIEARAVARFVVVVARIVASVVSSVVDPVGVVTAETAGGAAALCKVIVVAALLESTVGTILAQHATSQSCSNSNCEETHSSFLIGSWMLSGDW